MNYIEINQVKNYNQVLKKILTGHTDTVASLIILPNSNLVSGSWDSTIKIWNSTSFELIANLTDHTNKVSSLAILPNTNLVSGSFDSTIKIWNSTTFKLIKSIHFDDEVLVVAILPISNILFGIHDLTIGIIDGISYKIIKSINADSFPLSFAILSNNNTNTNIVAACFDSIIRIFDSESLELIKTLVGHTKQVNTVAILPISRYIVSGSDDLTIKIWNSTTFELIATLQSNNNYRVSSIVIYSNSSFASAGDKTIQVWDSTTFIQINAIIINVNSAYLVILPNMYIACGSDDTTIQIWTFQKLQYFEIESLYKISIEATALGSFKEQYLLIGSSDLSINIYDIATSKPFKILTNGHSQKITCFLSINNQFFLSGSADKKIIVWDSNIQQEVIEKRFALKINS